MENKFILFGNLLFIILNDSKHLRQHTVAWYRILIRFAAKRDLLIITFSRQRYIDWLKRIPTTATIVLFNVFFWRVRSNFICYQSYYVCYSQRLPLINDSLIYISVEANLLNIKIQLQFYFQFDYLSIKHTNNFSACCSKDLTTPSIQLHA